MKKELFISIGLGLLLFVSCKSNTTETNYIEENKLGIIDASVKSEDTNLKAAPKYEESQPGAGLNINRAFENAPPMIPHTIAGFLPIKIANNICMSCHMPDKVEESGAVQISETHLANWRPKPQLKDGKYSVSNELTNEKLGENVLNNHYFNCSQCHTPQAKVTVNIENLFTPEFRKEFGIKQSNLNDKVKEGL